jgi:hypothetical protein
VPGVHDRVLTVTGELKAITKAYRIVAKGLLEGAPQVGMGGLINPTGTHRKLYYSPLVHRRLEAGMMYQKSTYVLEDTRKWNL